MKSENDISRKIRGFFPSLKRMHNNQPLIYMDGPGGTQVPAQVVGAMNTYYENSNSNIHGFFPTSIETEEVIHDARFKVGEFLGAKGPHTISFGQNMTSLTFSLSKAIARVLQPGEEILITQLDHEANRAPWLRLREEGIEVREVNILEGGTLDYEDFSDKINDNTRLVAMGCASNVFGTVNDIDWVRKKTYEFGAWMVLDAVHHVPHFSIDVEAIGCEFLLCSAYKFYGPHVGILYSKPGLLDALPTDILRTQKQAAPHRIETGTLNHAALAGVSSAIDFICSLGNGEERRDIIVDAMSRLSTHERELGEQLYSGLNSTEGVDVVGEDFSSNMRAPTVSILLDKHRPEELCKFLGNEGICAGNGHFYAIRPIEVLGLLERGGVTRFGISAYTNIEEIEIVVDKVGEFVAQA
jgi:cysteine desulfurase family protein (TIGR01976 family)